MPLVPIFPLAVVLFPGVPLPLHIFEDRYRLLMRELLAQPEPREFGVIAVGRDGRLTEVGCLAELRHAEPYDDGRMDILTTGSRRFRVLAVDDALPYYRADVEFLEEEYGVGADRLAADVAQALAGYRTAVSAARDDDEPPADMDLPDDPALVSYLVAAGLPIDLPAKQELLETVDVAGRLSRELTWLRQETALVEHFAARPPDVHTAGPFSLN